MTSCDGNLMKYIPVQLESISANLSNRQINFYLFHDGKNISYVDKLKVIHYDNIKLYDVIVEDVPIYEAISRKGGQWCGAAYYSLCAQNYLPEDMDRIWYIDAGDIIVTGDVDDYYFSDFEGKSLIVTSILFKIENGKSALFTRDDLVYKEYLKGIARGIFNSGSYIMNLNKMRKKNYSIQEYAHLAELIYNARGKLPRTFYGDQGFLSLIYVGDVKSFGYPEIMNPLYMPYDFGIWYFDKVETLDYEAKVIHYIGDNAFKPWLGKYPTFLKRFQDEDNLKSFEKLNKNQVAYYDIWHKYALLADKRLDNCKIAGL